MVIGIARKGEGVEPQRIHRRQLQQPETRLCCFQMGQIEIDQVVAEQKVRAISEFVELCQCCRQVAIVEDQRLIDIRAYRGEGMNATILLADLKVERQATRRKVGVHVQ